MVVLLPVASTRRQDLSEVVQLKRVNNGDIVAGVCAILLLITPFMKLWGNYKFEVDMLGVQQSESTGAALIDGDAFTAIFSWLVVLAALVTVVVFVMRAANGTPTEASSLYIGLGGAMFVLLVLLFIMGPKDIGGALGDELGFDISGLGEGFKMEEKRGFMLFLGPLLAIGVALGGYMSKNAPATDTTAAPPAV